MSTSRTCVRAAQFCSAKVIREPRRTGLGQTQLFQIPIVTPAYNYHHYHTNKAASGAIGPKIECQCGTVSFRASRRKPLEVYICHCTECQKQSASAFGSSYIFPAEGMWPLPQSMSQHVGVWRRRTDSGNILECCFCKCCGVRVVHRAILPNGQPKPTVTVKAGCVEGFNLDGAKHIFTRSAVVSVPEGSDLGPPQMRPGMKVPVR